MRIDSTAFGRPGNGIFDGPSPIKTIDDGIFGDTVLSCPLSDGLGFSGKRYGVVIAPIVALGFLVSPSAIFGTIIPIGIDAIKGVLGSGFVSHVGKEIVKTGSPALTDGYAPAAIVGIPNVGFGIAARLHRGPGLMFGRASFVVCGNGVDLKATTTAGCFRNEVARSSDSGISAHATTQPTYVTAMIRGTFKHYPSSKRLTGQVVKSCHL